MSLRSRRIAVKDVSHAVELFYANGWTDGLPIIPPTEDTVEAMLRTVDRDPGEVVGRVAPRFGEATLEKIAINAVMAGCLPEYFPVVVAAAEAVTDEAYNLNGIQATTRVSAPLIIVNGPVRRALDINGGPNCFGQGWRANATIGRALRLVLINLGGGYPGRTDKACLGYPGKHTSCVAENEEASPWEPLHVARGLRAGESAVTVFACEAPHSVTDHTSTTGRGMLGTLADSMATRGNNTMHRAGEMGVVIGPEHAETLRAEGWSKAGAQQFLFDTARRPLRDLKGGGEFYGDKTFDVYWPKWVDRHDEDARIPVVRQPQDLIVFAAGGSVGRLSAVLPGWGALGSRAVTRKVAFSSAPGTAACDDGA